MMPAIGMIPMLASRMSVAFFYRTRATETMGWSDLFMNINPIFPAQPMLVLP